MRQTLIAASLIAVILIVVVALLHTSDMTTGYVIGVAEGLGGVAAIAVVLGLVGVAMAFLWNKK